MGCWNATCGISQLPIMHRDPIRLFLLGRGTSVTHDGRGGFCYPTGLWSPIGLPFVGTYDDYGGIEDPKQVAEELSKKVLAEYGIKDTSKKFLDEVERGKISLSQFGKVAPIGQVLVREDVWQATLGVTLSSWRNRVITRQTQHDEARVWVDKVVELRATGQEDAWHLDTEVEQFIYKRKEGSWFLRSLYNSSESSPYFGLYRVFLSMRLVRGEITPDDAHAILCEIADVYHVNGVLDGTRRAWGPQSGAGSQDVGWETHAGFSRMVAGIADTLRLKEEADQRREEDDDEDV